MPSPRVLFNRRLRVWARRPAVFLAAIGLVASGANPSAIAAAGALDAFQDEVGALAVRSTDLGSRGWLWPVERVRVARPYIAPAHTYGPGHRGIDLEMTDAGAVRAPADGVVAFAGSVAGRGILTIDHGGGLVTTFEPVSTSLAAGTPVRGGEEVADLSMGGHAASGQLHFGVRLDGEYINPLRLLGGVARAVLLPCCG